MRDDEAMARALALAAGARRRTTPNPWVGCVIVADGTVVGEGATQPPGSDHAEIEALREAGPRARGATAYVTLEPCAHVGRTGPCADALIDAGIARVVVALTDPDPRVTRRGIERLRAAGVDVTEGVGLDAAATLLAPYLHHRRSGRAFCVVKSATSLDGRTAAADGTSRWITGEAARADAHELRADSDAVVVGAGTALTDRPALTVRNADPAPRTQPLRVLLDGRGRVPAEGPLFDPTLAPTLVVTTEHASSHAVDAWRAAGAKVEAVDTGPSGVGVDPAATLELLGRLDVVQALVEGGATVHGSLLDAGLADRVVTYVAPGLLGARGRAAYGVAGPPSIDGFERWRLVGVRPLGDDVRLDYEPAGA
ncbi:MAG: diaminohydroxyphosphoribosylaminopyrimidine deaminase [Actinomycetota bacterium]|nr:diaminohydroxyphosphoribosylaminopyrimidine deaminase [Actinomycetota bacterium]